MRHRATPHRTTLHRATPRRAVIHMAVVEELTAVANNLTPAAILVGTTNNSPIRTIERRS
jgi:hypothetical protein